MKRIKTTLSLVLAAAVLNAGFSATPIQGARIERKVVGGRSAEPGGFPWMAALVLQDEPDNFFGQFCGASLIHPYWVITAAHCVEDFRPHEIEALFGAWDLDSGLGERIPILEIILHPEYNPSTFENDVALLRLETSAGAAYPPLPIIEDPALAKPGIMATIIGWGDTTGEGDYASILQEVSVPIVSNETANRPESYNGAITEKMLPAGFQEGGYDSCEGDSGGPLIVPGPGGRGWVLAGIVSFAEGCGEPDKYGINTRVSSCRPFILGYLYPGYAEWESLHNLSGRHEDADGDGIVNWLEYAFSSDPLTASRQDLPRFAFHSSDGEIFAAVRVRRPADSREIQYDVRYSTDFGAWDAATVLVGEEPLGDAGVVEATIRAPQPLQAHPAGFFSIAAMPSGDFAHGLRLLPYPGLVREMLLSADEEDPEKAGFHMKQYRLEPLPAGGTIWLSLRSREFDPVMEVIDRDRGEKILVSHQENRGAEDDRVKIIAAPGVRYLIKVTSGSPGETGEFTLEASN
jgi:hypothetical protein